VSVSVSQDSNVSFLSSYFCVCFSYQRYEDAINSVKSAIELGVVPGGGSTLAYLSATMKVRQT
jgi:hypothetical protein